MERPDLVKEVLATIGDNGSYVAPHQAQFILDVESVAFALSRILDISTVEAKEWMRLR